MRRLLFVCLCIAPSLPLACVYDIHPLVENDESPDSPEPTDTGPEASEATMGIDAGPCSGHLLCENFDEEAGWADAWSVAQTNATLAIATETFRSPPASLRVRAVDDAGPPDSALRVSAALSRSLELPSAGFRCAFSILAAASLEDAGALVPVVTLSDPAFAAYVLEYFAQGNRKGDEFVLFAVPVGDSGVGDRKPLRSVFDGQWHTITLEVRFDTAATTMSIDLGLPVQIDLKGNLALSRPPQSVDYYVGLTTNTPGWAAYFDDVVCDALR